MDVFYISRTSRDSEDTLYGEDPLKEYRYAYPLEMYMENVTGMDGEGDFISKFGLEIRDEVTLLVSRRRFSATVPLQRPREGDLVYIPLVQNFFEVTFVEHENDQAMFYTLGRGRGGNVYVYSIKMKQFVFSNEVIETGVSEIDGQIRDEYPRTRITLSAGGTGTYLINIPQTQGSAGTPITGYAAQVPFVGFNSGDAFRVPMFANNRTLTGYTMFVVSKSEQPFVYSDHCDRLVLAPQPHQ